jgi:hypothetical protein
MNEVRRANHLCNAPFLTDSGCQKPQSSPHQIARGTTFTHTLLRLKSEKASCLKTRERASLNYFINYFLCLSWFFRQFHFSGRDDCKKIICNSKRFEWIRNEI